MNFFKVIVVAGLLFYGIYWVSTDGVTWWQQREITKAVKKYHEDEGYYPLKLKRLTNATHTDETGEKKRYLTDIPIPRTGYCWEYNSDNGKVTLKRIPDDADYDARVCR